VMEPRLVTLWFDAAGDLVRETDEIRHFERALTDTNRRETWSRSAIAEAEQKVGVASLHTCFATVRANAPSRALASVAADGSVQAAVRGAEAAWTSRARVLRSRATRAGDAHAVREAHVEERLADALLRSLSDPRPRWDAAGVVVLEAGRM
jgi:hypothetical protein